MTIALLASAGFLIWQGITGTPLFIGNGSGWSTEINTTADSLRHAGVTPYSADQHLLTAIGVLLVVGFLPIYLGTTLRGQCLLYTIGCALEAALLATIVVWLSVWSATGHRYSNYLPLDYPESYGIPITFAGLGAVVFTAATIFFARITRRTDPHASRVRLWWGTTARSRRLRND